MSHASSNRSPPRSMCAPVLTEADRVAPPRPASPQRGQTEPPLRLLLLGDILEVVIRPSSSSESLPLTIRQVHPDSSADELFVAVLELAVTQCFGPDPFERGRIPHGCSATSACPSEGRVHHVHALPHLVQQ